MPEDNKPDTATSIPEKVREEKTDNKVSLGVIEGKIVLSFDKPLRWIAFTKDQAESFDKLLQEKIKQLTW